MQEAIGKTSAAALLGCQIQLPCDLRFGSKPSKTSVVRDKYVKSLRKKLNSTHENDHIVIVRLPEFLTYSDITALFFIKTVISL